MKHHPKFQGVSRIAREIASAILAHTATAPLTVEVAERIIQMSVKKFWRRESAHSLLRTKTRKMMVAALALTPEKAESCNSFCAHLGCDPVTFRRHIERQFTAVMNWGNYADVWEIDHIKPLRDFNLTVNSEYYACAHFKNLRPLLRPLNRLRKTPEPPKFEEFESCV